MSSSIVNNNGSTADSILPVKHDYIHDHNTYDNDYTNNNINFADMMTSGVKRIDC